MKCRKDLLGTVEMRLKEAAFSSRRVNGRETFETLGSLCRGETFETLGSVTVSEF